MPVKAPRRVRSVDPEALLQHNALAWLKWRGIVAWRVALGPVLHGGGRIRAKNPLAGFPDVCGVLSRTQPGRFWAVEFKSAKGRLRQNQEAWLTKLRDAGCAVAVVRHVGELEPFFRELGEIH